MVAFSSFAAGALVGGGGGFVVGAFTPAIGRKIKALFVKEATAVKEDIAKKV